MERLIFSIRVQKMKFLFLLFSCAFTLVFNQSLAQQFNPEIIRIKNNESPLRPYQFFDFDGDGDFDIYYYYNNDNLYLIENIGDSICPIFNWAKKRENPLKTIKVFNSSIVDIDSDGDYDIIGNKNGKIVWCENIGTKTNPVFNEMVELNVGLSVSIQNKRFVDIDGDGDFDVFGVRRKDGVGIKDRYIVFQENIGTSSVPAFSDIKFSPFNLPESLSAASLSIEFIDIDNDGDLDAYFTETYNQKGKCYILENVGNSFEPQFAKPKTDFPGLTNPFYIMTFADIDSDGQVEFVGSVINFMPNGLVLYYQEMITGEEE
ncbi:hypothetical protein SDC9_52264 [bioreactor metagenome]|uniref:VCBS repeat-containing protein n=1 Tax=bioreactor metagenome TaxID=1076179 RepID=A0A644WQK3_9ZZZZ